MSSVIKNDIFTRITRLHLVCIIQTNKIVVNDIKILNLNTYKINSIIFKLFKFLCSSLIRNII